MTPEDVLIAHQRQGMGCLCGWGQRVEHLGKSHAAHVLAELQKHFDITPRKGLRSTEATSVRELAPGLYRVAGVGSRSAVTGQFRARREAARLRIKLDERRGRETAEWVHRLAGRDG